MSGWGLALPAPTAAPCDHLNLCVPHCPPTGTGGRGGSGIRPGASSSQPPASALGGRGGSGIRPGAPGPQLAAFLLGGKAGVGGGGSGAVPGERRPQRELHRLAGGSQMLQAARVLLPAIESNSFQCHLDSNEPPLFFHVFTAGGSLTLPTSHHRPFFVPKPAPPLRTSPSCGPPDGPNQRGIGSPGGPLDNASAMRV